MNKKWLCEIYAISRITKELETFIAEEYIEAPTLEEAKQIASEEYPYLNPVEEIRELEMFQFEFNEKEPEFYLVEVSDDLILYN
jgi:hypothetical protein